MTTLTPAEGLVRRGVGTAPLTIATYDRLVAATASDAHVRLELRLAEHARDEGRLDDWASHLWTAIDRTRGGEQRDEPQPS